MKAILRWYLRRVLSPQIIRAIHWTPEERNAFELFCRTSCGIKLFEFLRQTVANATFNAVYRDSVGANSHARGMQDVLAILYRLRVFPEQEESEPEMWDSEEETRPGARGADDWRGFGGGRGSTIG